MNTMFLLTILAIIILTIVYVVLLHEQKAKTYKKGRHEGFLAATFKLKYSHLKYILAVLQDIQINTKHKVGIDYDPTNKEIYVYYNVNGNIGREYFSLDALSDLNGKRLKQLIKILNK